MRLRRSLSALLLAAATTGALAQARAETDPRTGLIIAPGWELVNGHCGGCHSHALVTAQRGDERFWRSTIRWMQRTQNLWEIPPQQEAALLAYLAEHYSESDWGRRPPLPALLLPGAAPISRKPPESGD